MTARMVVYIEWALLALIRARAVLLRRLRRVAAHDAALQRCRCCGCVDTHACIEISMCGWVEDDLCTSCASEKSKWL